MEKTNKTSSLSEDEKNHLRKRIMESAEKEKEHRSSLIPIISIAASVAILVLIGFGFNDDCEPQPSIEDYARYASEIDIEKAKGVTLILGNQKNFYINEENFKIQYSSSGEEVNIGYGKKVEQKVRDEETPIFNTLIVPFGKRTNLQLSDGTIVWLNSGSKLVFPAVFEGQSRSVYLEGEAIFDVVHNSHKPFKVISVSQQIEVLGTVFNVNQYPGEDVAETVLKSGSLNISYQNKGKRKIKLRPGMKASFNTATTNIRTKKVNVQKYFSWKNGFLTLKETSLKNIMKKLARYYNVEIIIEDEDLASQTFSGNLELKEDIKEVLEVVRHTSQFETEIIINNQMIIIKQNEQEKY